MRAYVDKETCVGCELCVAICPQVFEMSAEGVARAKEGEVGADAQERCRQAGADCPVGAIRVE